jgi:hypothetical protein
MSTDVRTYVLMGEIKYLVFDVSQKRPPDVYAVSDASLGHSGQHQRTASPTYRILHDTVQCG